MNPILLLAEVPDPQISGNWLIGLIGAVASAFALIYGKRQGLKEATNNVTVQSPFPELAVRKVSSPPTFSQHMALVERVAAVEAATRELRKDLSEQFSNILEAGHTRELRIIDKIEGVARGFHQRVDDLLKHDPKKTSR